MNFDSLILKDTANFNILLDNIRKKIEYYHDETHRNYQTLDPINKDIQKAEELITNMKNEIKKYANENIRFGYNRKKVEEAEKQVNSTINKLESRLVTMTSGLFDQKQEGGRKLYHRKRKSSRKKKSRRNNKSTKRIKRHSKRRHSKKK